MLSSEQSIQLICELMNLQASSGAEGQVRDYLRDKTSHLVDDIVTDGLGSLFAIKRAQDPGAPTVMFAGHMDEVGFMVETILDDGRMTVVSLGGWNQQVISAQRFTLQTAAGDYPIISSSIPPHLLKKESAKIELDQLPFDAGFETRDQALEAGVRPGDVIVPDVKTLATAHPHRYIGKAFDNRYGMAMVIEVLEALKELRLPFNLVAGGTVQEEVGLRGAKASINLIQPDLFIAADASPTSAKMGELGQGFLVRVQDPGMITPKRLVTWLVDLAEENDINYQYYFAKGGTDAVAAHTAQEGIPSCVIGCPAKYIHTHQSMFDMRDYYAARDMLIAIMQDLHPEKIEDFQSF